MELAFLRTYFWLEITLSFMIVWITMRTFRSIYLKNGWQAWRSGSIEAKQDATRKKNVNNFTKSFSQSVHSSPTNDASQYLTDLEMISKPKRTEMEPLSTLIPNPRKRYKTRGLKAGRRFKNKQTFRSRVLKSRDWTNRGKNRNEITCDGTQSTK